MKPAKMLQSADQFLLWTQVCGNKSDLLKYLRLFGLECKYPNKITLMEAVRVDINQSIADGLTANSFKEAPWKLLRGILSTHRDARDKTLSKLIQTDVNYTDTTDKAVGHSADLQLSSFDFFHMVIQCCDRTLQTIAFQKLNLCKIAFPFAFTDWSCELPKLTVLTWPLRFLMVKTKRVSESVGIETDVMSLQTKVAAFARFGRPKLSKSKLLNSLLDTDKCNYFFDEDCPSGQTPRTISNGCIEMSFIPKMGNDKAHFDTNITFLNVRGDLISDCSEDIVSLLGDISDIVLILTDIHCVRTKLVLFRETILQFSSVVLVFADCLTREDRTFLSNIFKEVSQRKSKFKHDYVSLKDNNEWFNFSVLKGKVLTALTNSLNDAEQQTFENRVVKAKCSTDEMNQHCQRGKLMAEKMLASMNKGLLQQWKEKICPAHFKHSIKLGNKLKQLNRANSIETAERKREKISKIRRLQMASLSESVKLFASYILEANQTDSVTEFFLGWLKHFIEREKTKVLPGLMSNRKTLLQQLHSEKRNAQPVDSKILALETKLKNIELSIDNASFSCNDFFHELSHIFDAYLEERDFPKEFCLHAHIEEIADVFSKCILNGQTIEIVDEGGFYMPYKWLQVVFNKMTSYIGSERIICLSVQGLQSSGKSTLLNTMFGAQFPVNVGRCTRGIHMQLVPVQFENSAEMPFRFIAVFDTEGLRSTETHCASHEHDNELATVITGIGDITIMNIMGESITEMKEILQIVVLAFLRLKKSNRTLDVLKTCYFVYHNIQDLFASQNMDRSMHTLIETLDEMAKDSAQREGALDVKTFNQVIEFDPHTDVSCLKCLWGATGSMASVSTEYAEDVIRLKDEIFLRAIRKEKTYWKIEGMLKQMHSLWEGVLKENFVFSFRNTMEIKAQTKISRFVENKLREFNKSVNEHCRMEILHNLAVCREQKRVEPTANITKQHLVRYLTDKKSLLLEAIDTYFLKHHRETVSNWKDMQRQRCEMFCSKIEKDIEIEIEKRREIRLLEILTNESQKFHEDQLMKESLCVAADIRNQGRSISEEEENEKFENIWTSFVCSMNMSSVLCEFPMTKLQSEFVNSLKEIFGTDELKEHLHWSDSFARKLSINRLVNSFQNTRIDENDCGWHYRSESPLKVRNDEMEKLSVNVNAMFSQFDRRIDQLDSVTDYIWEPEVRSFIYDLRTSVDEMKRKQIIVSGNSFEIKLFVHVCHYACQRFNEHNHNHFENQTRKRLNEYKHQQKITFKAQLRDRQFEATFASLLCDVLEKFAKDRLHIDITFRIKDYLHSNVPENKQSLIISILESLVYEDSFDEFMSYIEAPERYAGMWFMRLCNRYLYDKETKGYYEEARLAANDIYKRITMALSRFVTNHEGDNCLNAQECIAEIKGKLALENLMIPDDSFRVLHSVTGKITNVKNFDKIIQDLISSANEKLLGDMKEIPESIVKWHGFNPIEAVFKYVWGCKENCPFCWEPCKLLADHIGIYHDCIQHRPLCCTGSQTRKKHTFWTIFQKSEDLVATLETCNFLVNSDVTYNCETIGFICNEPNHERCVMGKHEYRDYSMFFDEWDIHPFSDMHESSKFWLWFIAKYKDFLTEKYNYQFGRIPQSWYAISPEEAIESLEDSFEFLEM